MKIGPAKLHHQVCPRGRAPHLPPSYLPVRGSEPLENREIVSNPISDKPGTNAKRLTIIHHNGQQVTSKFFDIYKTAADVKQQVARLTRTNVSDIKLYKFAHREIDDTESVKRFAPSDGANYICSFTSFQELNNRSANIIFQELGPPPRVERPPESNSWSGEPTQSNDDENDPPAWIRFWLNRQNY